MVAEGIVGLLLAAGQGRRFGGDKLLHPLPDGRPMALVAARALRDACPRSIAVLRPEQAVLAALLVAEGLEIAVCSEARAGMGHSLAAGVAASPDAKGWLVALADMPFLQPASLSLPVAALQAGAALAASAYRGRRGHPVGFAARWYAQLIALEGDEGARHILSAHPNLMVLVETDDPGVLRDVDRREDLV